MDTSNTLTLCTLNYFSIISLFRNLKMARQKSGKVIVFEKSVDTVAAPGYLV